MKPNSSSTIIFAYKYKDEFHPEHIVADWEEERANLEYDDVVNGNYQLWEYPEGVIWSIESDRVLGNSEAQFSTPTSNDSEKWLPVLKKIGTSKNKVTTAYNSFEQRSNS